MFSQFLKYKLERDEKKLIKVDKWFPSSKLCSAYDAKKDELALSESSLSAAPHKKRGIPV
jgi:putative transposase